MTGKTAALEKGGSPQVTDIADELIPGAESGQLIDDVNLIEICVDHACRSGRLASIHGLRFEGRPGEQTRRCFETVVQMLQRRRHGLGQGCQISRGKSRLRVRAEQGDKSNGTSVPH